LSDIQASKIKREDLDRFFGSVNELKTNPDDLKLLKQFDEHINYSLGLINFIYQTIEKKGEQGVEQSEQLRQLRMINERVIKFNEQIDKIISQKYVINNEGMFIEDNKNETWKVLGNVFAMFIDDKKRLDNIMLSTESYDDVIKNKLLIHLKKRYEEIELFKNYLDAILLKIKNVIAYMKKIVHEDLTEKHIKIISDTFQNEDDYMRMSYDKPKELLLGRETILLNMIPNISEGIIGKIRTDDIVNKSISEFLVLREKTMRQKNMVDETLFGIIQQGGNRELQDLIIKYDIEFQSTHKLLNDFNAVYHEFEELNMRFINYFLFQIACIIRLLSRKQKLYAFINKRMIQTYLKKLEDIVGKFNDIRSVSSERISIIKYLNVYHYFTIKKLYKFFSFLDKIVKDGEMISIDECVKEIYDNFIIFNQFKDLLNVY
jgi:hypothetical protein